MQAAYRMAVAIVAVGALGGCSKSTALTCAGTVQVVQQPATVRPVSGIVARVNIWPIYTKLWNRADGDVAISGTEGTYFAAAEVSGDNLLLSKGLWASDTGILNTVSGALLMSVGNNLYDLRCGAAPPLLK